MWTTLTEKRKFSGTNQEYEYKYLQREDGFTMMREGMGRDFEEIFACTGNFGKFMFYAERWDLDAEKATNKYIVSTKLTSRNWNLDEKINEQLILSHAKDIESALLSYPPARCFDFEPVKEVLFDLSKVSEGFRLVKSEDI